MTGPRTKKNSFSEKVAKWSKNRGAVQVFSKMCAFWGGPFFCQNFWRPVGAWRIMHVGHLGPLGGREGGWDREGGRLVGWPFGGERRFKKVQIGPLSVTINDVAMYRN